MERSKLTKRAERLCLQVRFILPHCSFAPGLVRSVTSWREVYPWCAVDPALEGTYKITPSCTSLRICDLRLGNPRRCDPASTRRCDSAQVPIRTHEVISKC